MTDLFGDADERPDHPAGVGLVTRESAQPDRVDLGERVVLLIGVERSEGNG